MPCRIPEIISKEELEKRATVEGLVNPKLFAEFMKERFPEERDWNYVLEWIDRFKTGSPEGYMDSKSFSIYKKLKEVV
jgi:hypothetical protein